MTKIITKVAQLDNERFNFYFDLINGFNFKFICLIHNENESILIVELKEYKKNEIYLFADSNEIDLRFTETETCLILNFHF